MDTQLRQKINEEIGHIPDDKIEELYDVIHFFRVGVESLKKEAKSNRRSALDFFGIWKDMSLEERAVLDEIPLRRQKTLRERVL